MKKSLSFYITIFVLKLKGLKKDFSKDPIDFKKIRKLDVKNPKRKWFKNKEVSQFKLLKTAITEVKPKEASDKLLIFIHGGAFISGPAQHHWDTIKKISSKTNLTIWLCDYPKAPENTISEISKNIDKLYLLALEKYSANHISILGDSVGGTLAISLIQRLIKNKLKLPSKILLISPVMDASMTNSKIIEIDKIDPMLSQVGLLSAKRMCAEKNDLKNVMMSPIHGNFSGFPKTILFLAENDITYPDQLLVLQKLTDKNIDYDVIIGKEMPHIWPLLPVMKEAKVALNRLISEL